MGELRGLVPIVPTPFAHDGSVDEVSLRRLVAFLLRCDVDGMGLLGFGSEAYTLTNGERERVIRIVLNEVAAAVPLVVGVGATGTAPAVEVAVTAEQAGADCLMVLPPYLVKPSVSGLVDYFRQVAAAVDIPIMIQDVPETGVAMPVTAFPELARIPGIAYAKIEAQPAASKISEIRAAIGSELGDGQHSLAILGGRNANGCIEEFAQGSVGTMPGSHVADLLRVVVDRWFAGDELAAQRAYNHALPLLTLGAVTGAGQAVTKEVLRLRGLIASSRVRAPTPSLDVMTSERVARVLASLDLEEVRFR